MTNKKHIPRNDKRCARCGQKWGWHRRYDGACPKRADGTFIEWGIVAVVTYIGLPKFLDAEELDGQLWMEGVV